MANPFVINWHCFLNTDSMHNAEVILNRMSGLLDYQFEVIESKPYWKDKQLVDVRLLTHLHVIGIEEALLIFLKEYRQLANGFQSSGLQSFTNNRHELTFLSSSGIRESGLRWLEATLSNTDELDKDQV